VPNETDRATLRGMGATSKSPTDLGQLIAASRRRRRGLVPVLGSGVAIQASVIDVSQPSDDWAKLLHSIAAVMGMTEDERDQPPGSLLAFWERLVLRWALEHGLEPYQAEARLHALVVQKLRDLERNEKGSTLYREFIEAGFTDILSLNFDRRLALASGGERFVTGPKKPPEGPSGRTLYRHSRVTRADGGVTRVWYPHGDTKRAETIKLGVRRYGFHLGLIRERLGLETSSWRSRKWGAPTWEESLAVDRGDDEGMDSWVDVFLRRPLVFLGSGLSGDEWSIWWLLQARFQSGRPPAAFFAHAGRLDRGMAALCRASGLTPVRFRSFDHLWHVVRGALR
jgi:hypothetical protein